MIQRCNGMRFLLKPSQAIGVGRRDWRQYLDGNITAKPEVAGPINFAHAPGANQVLDFVFTQPESSRQNRLCGRGIHEALWNLAVCCQHRIDFPAQAGIERARTIQKSWPFFWRKFHCLLKDLSDSRPWIRRHKVQTSLQTLTELAFGFR
jgi:hypothetical protein